MTSRVFSELKDLGMNVEIAPEYAKDLTWQESFRVLQNQVYIFGKQQHRLWRLDGNVQIILTDSPLLFSLVYGRAQTSDTFKALVKEEYRKRPTFDVYLNRVKPYNPKGRSQSEEEAMELDKTIKHIVETDMDGFHLYIDGHKNSVPDIVNGIINQYNKINRL